MPHAVFTNSVLGFAPGDYKIWHQIVLRWATSVQKVPLGGG